MKADVIILHDSGGEPYFQAIEYLLKGKKINSLCYLETSVFVYFLRALYRGRLNRKIFSRIFSNFIFRLKAPFIKDKTIILGLAPYDFRFLFYSFLSLRNNVIYHTSWPYWWTSYYPRKYLFLDVFLSKIFCILLNRLPIKIIGVIPEVKKSLSKKINSNMIDIIPHSIDRDIFYSADFSEEKNDINLLFVGRMQEEKGLNTILSLIRQENTGFFFHIVGDGIMLAKFKEETEGMANVKIYGKVKDKVELSTIYRKCDYFLLPSVKNRKWEELFGIVIIEAMSSGVIPIASDHIGPRNIIENGVDGFLFDFNSDQKTLFDLMRNCNRYSVSRAAIRSSKEYSISYISSLWEKVIDDRN